MSSPFPKTRWSRILRRTSTALSISNTTTPSIASDRDVDTASLSGVIKGPALKPPPSVVTSPSPIAESPIREAAAQETESPAGYIPSPIIESSVGNHTLFTDEPDELPRSDIVHEPHAAVSVEPHVEPATIPVPEPVPEEVGPLGDNTGSQTQESKSMIEANKLTVHGGKFTNVGGDYHDLRTRSTTYVVKNSTTRTEYLKNSLNPNTHFPAGETQDSTGYIVTPAADSAGDPEAFINPQPDVTQDPYALAAIEPRVEPATIDAPEPVIVESPHEHEQEPKSTLTEEVLVEERTSYSDELTAESVKDFEPADPIDNMTAFSRAVHDNATPLCPELDLGEIVECYNGDIVPATSEAMHENDTAALPELDLEKVEAQADNHDQVIAVTTESERQEIQQTTEVISTPVLVPTYKVPSYLVNLGSGQEVWGGEHGDHPYKSTYPSSVPAIIPSSEDLKRVERSPAPSIRIPQEDPFADPIAPEGYMTQPEILEEYHHDPTKTRRDRDMPDPIVMPLLSFHEVISKPIQHPLSRDGDIGKLGTPVETDENFPLLPRPGTPNKHRPTSYLQASAQLHSHSHTPHVPSTSQSTTSNGHANSWNPDLSSLQRRHTPSWTGYHLPDGTVYYVHPTSRVTTDINLGNERTLTNVERFLADHDQNHSGTGDAVEAGEMWLRDVGTAKSGGMVLERWWVDHVARTVVRVGDEREYGRRGSEMGKGKKGGSVLVEEDQLDSEYRYWSFVEAHPAHNPLSAKAKMEAMNVLTWAWTERLLPSHRSTPAPFTQEECQELMTLMRSFSSTDDHLDDYGIQTRIVSRVLIRVAHWRQKHLRPDKPLPANVSPSPSRLSVAPRGRLRRAIDDFLVSFRFLGVPLNEPKFP